MTLYLEQNDGGQGSGEYRYVDNLIIQSAATPSPSQAANLGQVPLVSQGALWRYRDTGVVPSSNWREAAFNDSTWSRGPARLGYGGDGEATTVGYGPNSSAKYITTWFRHTFVVRDASTCQGLLLRVTRDDGVIVSLNGTEVWRSNLTNGTVASTTAALSAISSSDELIFQPLNLSGSLLRTGTNVLAAEVHQSGGTSSDLGFDAELLGEFLLPAPLIAAGGAWKYRDNGVDPGQAWRGPDFDDSTWSNGVARLGYGGDGEATRVGYGSDPNNKYITTWFRRSFLAPDPALFGRLRLRLVRDDGAVVHLNGEEIFRSNMDPGPITASTPAAFAVSGIEEQQFVTVILSPHVLRAGSNVLAVEAHQAAASSSDLGFDLELVGDYVPLEARPAAGNMVLAWPMPAPAHVLEAGPSVAATSSWTRLTNATMRTNGYESVAVPRSSPSTFFRLRQDVVDASTLWHKHLFGYQGWFACTNDGSPPALLGPLVPQPDSCGDQRHRRFLARHFRVGAGRVSSHRHDVARRRPRSPLWRLQAQDRAPPLRVDA